MATKKLRLATAVLAAVATLAAPFARATTQGPATVAGRSQTATLNVGDFDW